MNPKPYRIAGNSRETGLVVVETIHAESESKALKKAQETMTRVRLAQAPNR